MKKSFLFGEGCIFTDDMMWVVLMIVLASPTTILTVSLRKEVAASKRNVIETRSRIQYNPPSIATTATVPTEEPSLEDNAHESKPTKSRKTEKMLNRESASNTSDSKSPISSSTIRHKIISFWSEQNLMNIVFVGLLLCSVVGVCVVLSRGKGSCGCDGADDEVYLRSAPMTMLERKDRKEFCIGETDCVLDRRTPYASYSSVILLTGILEDARHRNQQYRL